MSHVVILCPPAHGHINPLACLGRVLQARGHRVTMPQILDMEGTVVRNGLEYLPLAEKDFPRGWLPGFEAKLGGLRGPALARATVQAAAVGVAATAGNSNTMRTLAADLLLVDQFWQQGSSIAEHFALPFVTVCCGQAMVRENAIPPSWTGLSYSPSLLAALRNNLTYAATDLMVRPLVKALNDLRRKWRLKPLRRLDDCYSPFAILAQQPAAFDYPRRALPDCFHYTGPFHDSRGRPPVPFPFEQLNGKPLIYASMGTVGNRVEQVFLEIARACVGLDAQLVVSLGGGKTPAQIGALPGAPLVVGYAPQLDLLARSALTITHAGMNTALESLSFGVPMVAIPVSYDQPGVAARVKWTGAGEVLPLARLRSDRLRPLVERVLTQKSYRLHATRLQAEIRKVDGVNRSADIVERILSTGKPVLRYATAPSATKARLT